MRNKIGILNGTKTLLKGNQALMLKRIGQTVLIIMIAAAGIYLVETEGIQKEYVEEKEINEDLLSPKHESIEGDFDISLERLNRGSSFQNINQELVSRANLKFRMTNDGLELSWASDHWKPAHAIILERSEGDKGFQPVREISTNEISHLPKSGHYVFDRSSYFRMSTQAVKYRIRILSDMTSAPITLTASKPALPTVSVARDALRLE